MINPKKLYNILIGIGEYNRKNLIKHLENSVVNIYTNFGKDEPINYFDAAYSIQKNNTFAVYKTVNDNMKLIKSNCKSVLDAIYETEIYELCKL